MTAPALSAPRAQTRPAYVCSISGTSGAGKSTVIEHAARRLPGAVMLRFDDYVTLGNDIAEIRAWIDAGADLDEIRTPQLAIDLAALRAGQAVRAPDTGAPVEPGPVILLEEPFGRSRRELSDLIDLAVFIDAPPDVALARRLLREVETWRDEPERLAQSIDIQMQAYLAVGREAYLHASTAARASSDLVLDAARPIEALAAELAAAIATRAGAGRAAAQ